MEVGEVNEQHPVKQRRALLFLVRDPRDYCYESCEKAMREHAEYATSNGLQNLKVSSRDVLVEGLKNSPESQRDTPYIISTLHRPSTWCGRQAIALPRIV